jgi:hypothetical protein
MGGRWVRVGRPGWLQSSWDCPVANPPIPTIDEVPDLSDSAKSNILLPGGTSREDQVAQTPSGRGLGPCSTQ